MIVKITTVLGKQLRHCFILIVAVIIAGCSTNALVVRYLYSQLDDNLNKKILSFAVFSEPQKVEVRNAVDAFFVWHSRQELPRYVAFIAQQNLKLSKGSLIEEDLIKIAQRLRDFTDHSYSNSPFSLSSSFLKELTDQQVGQIEQYFVRRDLEVKKEQSERSPDENGDRRLSVIVKNLKRFGVRLDQSQQEIVRASFSQYQKLPIDPRVLWNRWEVDFIALLKNRDDVNFEHTISEHLAIYPYLLRNAYPHRDEFNRQILVNTAWRVIQTLTSAQTKALGEQLDHIQQILLDISQS